MVFEDRIDAARMLAVALARYRGQHPLVLAIPRGAVPMGRVVADALEGQLDVVLVRKLGAPGNPEFAVGAVDEAGWTYVANYAADVGASASYLADETATQLATMRARRALYTPARSSIDPEGRVVIVIDDGLATGATMIAALHSVRARHPARLVCAVPVASPDSLEHVRSHADEVVCLDAPLGFHAVGQFYRTFGQVEDSEVIAVLADRKAHESLQ
jgi:putative phosphoribosyl transferase